MNFLPPRGSTAQGPVIRRGECAVTLEGDDAGDPGRMASQYFECR
jgi:hypothetical protein